VRPRRRRGAAGRGASRLAVQFDALQRVGQRAEQPGRGLRRDGESPPGEVLRRVRALGVLCGLSLCGLDVKVASARDKWVSSPLSCRGHLPCCQPRICSSTCTCWSMTRSAPGPLPSRPGQGRRRPAPMPSCWPSRWCSTCWAGAARPGFWRRWPGTGCTCSRSCRTKARLTGGSAGCGAPSSSCGRCWPPGCPKMTASRPAPPRCRSSTPPGPRRGRLDRSRQRPGRPVRPRRRARRVVLRLPAGHQGRPRLASRPGLEHRARRGQRARGRR
jgi:hypothetical protein